MKSLFSLKAYTYVLRGKYSVKTGPGQAHVALFILHLHTPSSLHKFVREWPPKIFKYILENLCQWTLMATWTVIVLSSQITYRQKPLHSSVPSSRIFSQQLLLFFLLYVWLVQGFDLITLLAYPRSSIYVLDLDIKCNTMMLNFSRAEYVGEGGRGPTA